MIEALGYKKTIASSLGEIKRNQGPVTSDVLDFTLLCRDYLPWILLVSVFLHLLGWWFLDKYTLRNEMLNLTKRPTIAMTVVFKSQPRLDNTAGAMPPHIQSKPTNIDMLGVKHETVPKLSQRSPVDMAKTVVHQEPASAIKIEADAKVQTPGPKLNLSKILDDVHQLAKEAESPADEQQFDKRKLRITPGTMKSPDVKATEAIESYNTPDGDLHICHPGLNGKKVCAHVAPQDPLNSLDVHVFQYDMSSPEKTPGDLLGERLKEVISK